MRWVGWRALLLLGSGRWEWRLPAAAVAAHSLLHYTGAKSRRAGQATGRADAGPGDGARGAIMHADER